VTKPKIRKYFFFLPNLCYPPANILTKTEKTKIYFPFTLFLQYFIQVIVHNKCYKGRHIMSKNITVYYFELANLILLTK